MAKRQREEDAESGQNPEIAVNFQGWVMEDAQGRARRGQFQEITAYPATTKKLSTALKAAHHARSFFPSNMDFTVKEIAPPNDSKTCRYLIIGYTFPELEEKYTHKAPPKPKKKHTHKGPPKVKKKLIPFKDFNENPSRPPIYVVTPITSERGINLRYYALAQPKDGLCTPFIISQDDVFFRAEFRDSSIGAATRKKAWNEIVSQYRDPNNACNAQKKARYISTQPEQLINEILDQQMSAPTPIPGIDAFSRLPKHLASLRTAISNLLQARPKNQFTKAIEQATAKLEQMQPPINSGLKAFRGSEFTIKDANALIAEVESIWGREATTNLTDERVLTLHACLHASSRAFEDLDLATVLIEGTYLIKQWGTHLQHVPLALLGRQVIDTLRHFSPTKSAEMRTAVQENDEKLRQQYKGMQDLLGEIKTACEKNDGAMRSALEEAESLAASVQQELHNIGVEVGDKF